MKKIAGAMALGVVLAIGSVTAAEAAPKTFKVSVKVSKTTAEFGSSVKITGKVSGDSSRRLKGKRVTVQRKYATGGWKKVGTAKISSKRTFSLSTKLVAGGDTSFRVVKSKSGKTRTGTSAIRTLPVYKWIDLTTAPSIGISFGLKNHPVTLNGHKYTRALQGLGGLMVGFNAAKCTSMTTVIGFQDKEKSGLTSTDSMSLVGMSGNMSGTPTTQGPYVVTRDQVKKVTINFSNVEAVVLQGGTTIQTGQATSVLADPLVRCNSDSLAQIPDSWDLFGPV